MSEESSKVKVQIGVIFSAKELEFEVEGDAAALASDYEGRISGGAKTVAFDTGSNKHVVVPVDKIAYIEFDGGKKSSSIGFNF